MARDLDAHKAWLATDGWRVLDLIRKFQFPPAHGDLGRITADTSLFADYVADRIGQELAEWDVILPLNSLKSAERATAARSGSDRPTRSTCSTPASSSSATW